MADTPELSAPPGKGFPLSNPRLWILLSPFLIWAPLFVLGPLSGLVRMSFRDRTPLGEVGEAWTLAAYSQLFDPLYATILLRTLGYALVTAVTCVIVAYPCAFFLARLREKHRALALIVVVVPFWTNSLIRLLALSDVLRWHPFGWDGLYTPGGVLMGYLYNNLPVAILPLYARVARLDVSLFEAGRDLGARGISLFTRVAWPLTRPGAATAALFVFVPALGEFLIPDLIGGGRTFVLGNFLQNQFLTARNWPLGAAAITLLASTALAIAVGSRPSQEGRLA